MIRRVDFRTKVNSMPSDQRVQGAPKTVSQTFLASIQSTTALFNNLPASSASLAGRVKPLKKDESAFAKRLQRAVFGLPVTDKTKTASPREKEITKTGRQNMPTTQASGKLGTVTQNFKSPTTDKIQRFIG